MSCFHRAGSSASAARLGAGTGALGPMWIKGLALGRLQAISDCILDGPVSRVITAQVGSITSFTSSRLTKVNGI